MAEPLGRLALLLREKINLAVPGEFSGRAWFCAWRNFWRRVSFTVQAPSHEKQTLVSWVDDGRDSSPELYGLIDTLKGIRERILADALLRGWTKWLVWILFGLIAVAAVSAKLAGALLFVGIVAVAGAAAIFAGAWRNRPSNYEAARRLDSAAGLQDRISTAIFLGGVAYPDGLIGEQRKDALRRLANVEPRGFFPIRLPRNIRRAGLLVLIVAGLFAYRIHHQPPLVSLLQSTARSQLVQSIFSPIVHAMEKDLQRTIALVTMKADMAGEEARRGDAASSTDDLWKANDDKGPGAEDQKDSADASDQPQDNSQTPGNQEGAPTGEARPQDSNSQSQDGKNGSDSADGKSQQQSEQQGPEGRQSLGQSLMQALKNMMSNSPNQQSNSHASQQPPNGQGTPQSGNSQQPGATESDKRGESRGNSDAKQKATQTASEGAGSQQGTKELRKDQETHPVNAVPDRVALEASGFKEQTRMKIATETGTAQLAVRDTSPQQDAVINGAEQENIPARYRFYVQRYFEHADNGKH
ncbi:MAG TPA: hypothetical protein VGP19_05435 [Candidatus Acidoferrales bacterium]|jgi:hypothetical protein|nr:hypothetical protein [Candidatus Acidoferrales bacterium]